jgi:hypothetical protein
MLGHAASYQTGRPHPTRNIDFRTVRGTCRLPTTTSSTWEFDVRDSGKKSIRRIKSGELREWSLPWCVFLGFRTCGAAHRTGRVALVLREGSPGRCVPLVSPWQPIMERMGAPIWCVATQLTGTAAWRSGLPAPFYISQIGDQERADKVRVRAGANLVCSPNWMCSARSFAPTSRNGGVCPCVYDFVADVLDWPRWPDHPIPGGADRRVAGRRRITHPTRRGR